MQATIKNVRLAFPAIAAPQAFGDGEPAYGAKLIVEPGSEADKAITAAIKATAKDQWDDKAPNILKMLKGDKKICYVEEEYCSKKTGEPYAGFAGMHYLNTRSAKLKPTVFTKFGEELTDKSAIEQGAYSGAMVNASIEIWAQDNKWGRRINCTLRGIMLTGDGESFGGGSAASGDEFADMFADGADLEDIL